MSNRIKKSELEELRRQQAQIAKEIEEAEEEERKNARREAIDHVESFSEEEKKFILSLLKHNRSSCSDENPCNGIYFDNYSDPVRYGNYTQRGGNYNFRCPKCALMEIFDGAYEGRFDFFFDATIFSVDTEI